MTMWKVTLALYFFIPAFIIAGKVDKHFSNFGKWMRIPEKNLADCTVMSNGFVIPFMYIWIFICSVSASQMSCQYQLCK